MMVGDRHKFHFRATVLQEQSPQVIIREEMDMLGVVVGL